jgi:thiol:disulfide interchange protein DsbD
MIESFIQGLAVYHRESFVLAYLAVYLGGVLVSFTPCVYPVIPITIAFIGARGSVSRGRGFLLSVFYVLGLSVTYTALGGFAALSGKLFGLTQTSPWVFLVMANLCLLMGLSMLDVFVLPVRIPQFVARLQPHAPARGMASSFFIGAASGLVMGPCTAPVMAVLLGFVATRQDLFYAVSLLFVFSFGTGTLLIIVGTFAGLLANLPKSGAWMTRINHFFGWIMIATSEYFLIQAGILWT